MVSIETKAKALKVLQSLISTLQLDEFRDLAALARPLTRLMLGIAFLESRFEPSARNKHSTAEGVWQLVRASRPLHQEGYSFMPNSARLSEQTKDAIRLVRKWRRFDGTLRGKEFREQAIRCLTSLPSVVNNSPSLAGDFLRLLGVQHGSSGDILFLLMLPIHWSIGGSTRHIMQGVRYLRRLTTLLSGRG